MISVTMRQMPEKEVIFPAVKAKANNTNHHLQ
jgi:hypothetical protein